jgi:hypothetical protein
MRTYKKFLPIASIALCLSLLLSVSCKKDEAPPAKPKLSMKEATRTVKESDGEIEIKMKLDKGAFEDVKVNYELSGTAVDKVTAGTTQNYDYEITSDYLSTKITKGDSIGIIKIKLWSDLDPEGDETIEIKIKNADTDNVEITRNDDTKITLKQEDGVLIRLDWDYTAKDSVDMDLFFWAKGTNGSLGLIAEISSTRTSYFSPEGFFLPIVILKDATYGLSCNYYYGKVEPMNFTLSFIKLIGGVEKPVITRKGTYTLKNLNQYDKTKVNPLLVQTFDKAGADFANFSEITTPASGSRIESTNTFLPLLKKEIDGQSKNDLILQFLNRR